METNEKPVIAKVRVGAIVELPIDVTGVETDADFLDLVNKNEEIQEAFSYLLSSALTFRDSKKSRAEAVIRSSKLVLFHDETTEQPLSYGWRGWVKS